MHNKRFQIAADILTKVINDPTLAKMLSPPNGPVNPREA